MLESPSGVQKTGSDTRRFKRDPRIRCDSLLCRDLLVVPAVGLQ